MVLIKSYFFNLRTVKQQEHECFAEQTWFSLHPSQKTFKWDVIFYLFISCLGASCNLFLFFLFFNGAFCWRSHRRRTRVTFPLSRVANVLPPPTRFLLRARVLREREKGGRGKKKNMLLKIEDVQRKKSVWNIWQPRLRLASRFWYNPGRISGNRRWRRQNLLVCLVAWKLSCVFVFFWLWARRAVCIEVVVRMCCSRWSRRAERRRRSEVYETKIASPLPGRCGVGFICMW